MSVSIFDPAVPTDPLNVIRIASGSMKMEAHGFLGNDLARPGNAYYVTVPAILRCTVDNLVIVFVRWQITSTADYIWPKYLGDGPGQNTYFSVWDYVYSTGNEPNGATPNRELYPRNDALFRDAWEVWCFPGEDISPPWATNAPWFFIDFGSLYSKRLFFRARPYFFYDTSGQVKHWYFHEKFALSSLANLTIENQFARVMNGQFAMQTPVRFGGRLDWQWESRKDEFNTYDYQFSGGTFDGKYSGRTRTVSDTRVAALNPEGGDDNRIILPPEFRNTQNVSYYEDLTISEPTFKTVPLYLATPLSLREISEPPLPGNEITLEVKTTGKVAATTDIRAHISASYANHLVSVSPPDSVIEKGKEGTAEFEIEAKADADSEDEDIPIYFSAPNTPLVTNSPTYQVKVKDAARPHIVLSTRLLSLAIPSADARLIGGEIVRAGYRVFLSDDPQADVTIALTVSPLTPHPGISVSPISITLNSQNYQEGVEITAETDNRDLKLNEILVTHTSSSTNSKWNNLTATLLIRERLSLFVAPPLSLETVPTYGGRRYGRYADSDRHPPAISGKYYVSRKVLDLVNDTMLLTAREAIWQDTPAEVELPTASNILDGALDPVPGKKRIAWPPISPVDSYSLRYREKTDPPGDWIEIEEATKSYIASNGEYVPALAHYDLTGLVSGRKYEVSVRANDLILSGIGYTNIGEGPWSLALEILIP